LCFWLLFFSFSLHMLYFDTKMKREREREFPETKRAMCRLYQCACINISTPLCVCVWYLCVTIHVLKTQMTNNSKHASVHSERGGLSLLFQKHTLLAACILKTLFATKNNLLFLKQRALNHFGPRLGIEESLILSRVYSDWIWYKLKTWPNKCCCEKYYPSRFYSSFILHLFKNKTNKY